MSTIKSSSEHLTLNADGASKDIKFQANGVEKASISSAGAFTSTTIDATKLTGNLPAIDGSSLTGVGGGKVLQVVYGEFSGGYVSTTSTSDVDAEVATSTFSVAKGNKVVFQFFGVLNYSSSSSSQANLTAYITDGTNTEDVTTNTVETGEGKTNTSLGVMLQTASGSGNVNVTCKVRHRIADSGQTATTILGVAPHRESSYIIWEIEA